MCIAGLGTSALWQSQEAPSLLGLPEKFGLEPKLGGKLRNMSAVQQYTMLWGWLSVELESVAVEQPGPGNRSGSAADEGTSSKLNDLVEDWTYIHL